MERIASSIFCDDIRLEVGNKHTYVGVYNGVMYVPQFPIVLAKLCVHVSIRTSASHPLKNVTVRILRDSEVLAEAPFNLESVSIPMQDIGELEKLLEPDDRLNMFGTAMIFSPLPLDKETMLRVRVLVDGEEIKAPALRILQAPAVPAAAVTVPSTPENFPKPS